MASEAGEKEFPTQAELGWGTQIFECPLRGLPALDGESLSHPPQAGDGDGTVGPRRDLPGKLIAFQVICAHLRGVVPIGERSPVDVKRDRAFGGIDGVTAKVNTHAERGVLVFLRSPFKFVSGRKPWAFGAIDLDRVVSIGREDDESVRAGSVVGNASAVGKQALGGGEGPRPNNASDNRGSVSAAGRALRSLRSADDGRNKRQE